MYRLTFCSLALVISTASALADSFDHYTNKILAKAVTSTNVEKLSKLTQETMMQHGRVLPGVTGTPLIVRTNEGRFARLLVQPGRHKTSATESVPIVLIERFVTFREGEERTILATGQNVRLFAGFHYLLDVGQVVPADLGGDLRVVVENGEGRIEPVGKAEFYLLTKPLDEASPKKAAKITVGDTFETRYFNGEYKLYDDGRRAGNLTLKVAENGDVTGSYFSDKDGQKYDVEGKVGNPTHSLQFKIFFPRSFQSYQGLMFTGDGRAIAGSSLLQNRETAFYAIRIEDGK